MLCYSLFDDPDKSRFKSYVELNQSREAMMMRTLMLKEQNMSCVYLDMQRTHVIPIGVTTTHAFSLVKQNRRLLLVCLPLFEERDSAHKAFLENRRPVSPWKVFDALKLSPKLDVLATACYRGIVCVLFRGRLLVACHHEQKWSVVADRELPFDGKPWTPIETLAVCAQCVTFVYRNEEEKCCYVYAIPLSAVGENNTPMKAKVNALSVRVLLPEEIYDHDKVYGAVYDERGRTCRFQVDLKEEKIEMGEVGDCPWPTISNTTFMQVRRDVVCYYSHEREQLVFFKTGNETERTLRVARDAVLSVEMFQEYAAIHCVNDTLEMVNMTGERQIRTKLLRDMTRRYADIAVQGLPKNSPVKPFPSTRTFASSFFVMFHDGTLCQFQNKVL